ncbi:RabGAP/TBC, partial [Martensiomyces pterosporus]
MARRLAEFSEVLFSDTRPAIDLRQLASLCFRGIPDVGGLRSLCWQLLLGYLPPDRRKWPAVLKARRQSYFDLVSDFARNPRRPSKAESTERGHGQGKQHLLEQIRADINRTMPDIALFHTPIYQEEADDSRCGTNALARILFVHAQFNRGVGYAQGMNEILAPIYYVLASCQPAVPGGALGATSSCIVPAPETAGAIARLSAPTRSTSQSPDVSALTAGEIGGLQHILKYWWCNYVRLADRQLWMRMDGLGIQPEHFALRWLLVWGAREFSLPDVLLLWDALMANRARLATAHT